MPPIDCFVHLPKCISISVFCLHLSFPYHFYKQFCLPFISLNSMYICQNVFVFCFYDLCCIDCCLVFSCFYLGVQLLKSLCLVFSCFYLGVQLLKSFCLVFSCFYLGVQLLKSFCLVFSCFYLGFQLLKSFCLVFSSGISTT